MRMNEVTKLQDVFWYKTEKSSSASLKKKHVYMSNCMCCSLHARPVAGGVTLQWRSIWAAEFVYSLSLARTQDVWRALAVFFLSFLSFLFFFSNIRAWGGHCSHCVHQCFLLLLSPNRSYKIKKLSHSLTQNLRYILKFASIDCRHIQFAFGCALECLIGVW